VLADTFVPEATIGLGGPPAMRKCFRVCSALSLIYACVIFAQENSGTIVKQSHLETRGRPTGTLIVSNKPAARGEWGEEGYVVFFTIRSSSGSRLEETSIAGGSKASVLFTVSADTKYELLSYVRKLQ
jgi:hypothetical protein